MREKELTGRFGEHLAAHIFANLGFETDMSDAEGIDLACYKKDGSGYGVSVKTRNIQVHPNNSINLTYNDIVYTYEQSKEVRRLEPAYAFIVVDLKQIDVLIVTQKYVFDNFIFIKDKEVNNIDDYKRKFKKIVVDNKPHIEPGGSTKSVSITENAKKQWKDLKDEPGVIFTASYRTE